MKKYIYLLLVTCCLSLSGRLYANQNIVRAIGRQTHFEQPSEYLSRDDAIVADRDLFARTKPEVDHCLEFLTMPGVADRLVIEFA